MNVPEAPTWAPVPDDLGRLAASCGVATEYWDQGGTLVQVGAATVEAVWSALAAGIPVPADRRPT